MDGNRKQVWRQLAVMYQGLLFLGGHVVDPGLATGEDRRARSRDATGEAAAHRHSRAQVRLDVRRMRAGKSMFLTFSKNPRWYTEKKGNQDPKICILVLVICIIY